MADESKNIENIDDNNDNNEQQKTFTQEQLEKILAERLARAKKQVPDDYDELKKKAAKYDEIEEQNKTELEKLTERAEAAEQKLQQMEHEAELNAWRANASQQTGVPAEVLRGDTEEEILQHAKAIQGAMPIYPQVHETGGTPNDMTKAQIMAIKDTQERQAQIAAHPELF